MAVVPAFANTLIRNARSTALSTAALITLVGVFAPWLKSGSSRRSSFELFDLVERLGFAPNGPFAWAVRIWPLVPLLLVAASVAACAHRPRLGGALGLGVGVYVATVSAGVFWAPDAGLITTDWGVIVSLISSPFVLVTSVWILRSRRIGGEIPSGHHFTE